MICTSLEKAYEIRDMSICYIASVFRNGTPKAKKKKSENADYTRINK